MPIRVEKWFAVICPVCGKHPDMGSDYTPLFQTRAEAKDALDYHEYETLEEKIAENCGRKCEDAYHHRKGVISCGRGLCGICGVPREERVPWVSALYRLFSRARGVVTAEFYREWGLSLDSRFTEETSPWRDHG